MAGIQILPPGVFGHSRCVVERNYALLPPEGILKSDIPGIEKTAIMVQTSPDMGARFAQIMLKMEPGGGFAKPRNAPVQNFFYVVSGSVAVELRGAAHVLERGGFCYTPSNTPVRVYNSGREGNEVIWIKKPYEPCEGYGEPEAFVSHRDAIEARTPHTKGRYWIDLLPASQDMAFDFAVNILGFQPGNYFPVVETHVMEHGLYWLEGQAIHLLGDRWHEVWTGDFIYMAPFVPQFCYITGWGKAEYLLYKNVNRDISF